MASEEGMDNEKEQLEEPPANGEVQVDENVIDHKKIFVPRSSCIIVNEENNTGIPIREDIIRDMNDCAYELGNPGNQTLLIRQIPETREIAFYMVCGKGTHQKAACFQIKRFSEENFLTMSCGWYITEFVSSPRALEIAGISIQIRMAEQTKLLFKYSMKKVLEKIEDVRPLLHKIFENGTQIRMRKMFQGRELTKDLEFVNESETTEIMLNTEKFLRILKKYKEKNYQPVPLYKIRENLLNCDLMPYQVDTVRWMVHREVHDSVHDLNPIWNKTEDFQGRYYYPQFGVVTENKSEWDLNNPFMRQFAVRGGILGDEMGLGKTVQVLALIATHQKTDQRQVEVLAEEQAREPRELQSNESLLEQIEAAKESYKTMRKAKKRDAKVYYVPNESSDAVKCAFCLEGCSASICGWQTPEDDPDLEFICPSCMTFKKPRKQIKTTLVILPESLIHQWFTEISKHCSNDLKVLFYFGLLRSGYLQPHVMDSYDVILTTYDALRSEASFTNESGGAIRHAKSQYLTTSLIHVKFWRVVVDEAQLIPRDASGKLAQFLLKIDSEHFWCVTGTPLTHSIKDIQIPFQFLDLYPFCFKSYFNNYAIQHYLKMCHDNKEDTLPPNLLMDTLSRIFSRKTKEDVKNQLNLPTLVEQEIMIQFTAIEERQYKEEKEKLKKTLQKLIEHVDGDTYIKDMLCREKVLWRLASLRGLILTGEKRRAGEANGLSYIYSPETIIFRLMSMKKNTILQFFRSAISHLMGLAGVYQLQEQFDKALETYQQAFRYLDDVKETEAYIQQEIGFDEIKRVMGVKPKQADELPAADFPLAEVDDLDENEETEAAKQKSAFNLKEIKNIRKKYFKTADEEKEISDAIETKEGPAAKKRKKNEVPGIDEEIVDDQMETEEEKKKREEHNQKSARIAFKPMMMDGTQEVHLTMNLQKLQIRFEDPNVVSTDGLKAALLRYMRNDVRCLRELSMELQQWVNIWDKDYIGKIMEYFTEWGENKKDNRYPEAFFSNTVKLQPIVVNQLLPYLPFNPIYDDGGATKELKAHNLDSCMGGCSPHHEPAMFVNMNTCLPLPEIILKTAQHLQYLTKKRVTVEKQATELIELLIGLSGVDNFDFLLTAQPMANVTEKEKKIMMMMNCKHDIIKGTLSDKRQILPKSFYENPCLVCELHTSISLLNFELGYSTFHGYARHNSGVLEFIKFLDTNFSADTYKSDKFTRLILTPFFDRFKSFVTGHFKAVLICLELVDRLDELKTANSLITDELLVNSMPRKSKSLALNREAYVIISIAQAASAWQDATKHLKEIRYLTNLLKEQIGGIDEVQPCLICDIVSNSFMVFTCGHRLCNLCWGRLKNPSTSWAVNELAKGRVPCPHCRRVNSIKEVMVAKSGHTETETVIPGVQLSAKMSTAIKLMRDIIEEDKTNKILLFTSIDQSNINVWKYIQKILKQAGLKHWLLTKTACAKRLVEFQVSEEANILLCPLTFAANGLNITSANHIIFLDPPHLRSVLQQAMGRINRHGQKRDMKVWHLLVEGSLDMQLRSSAMMEDQHERENRGWTCGDIRAMFDIEYKPKNSSS